MEKHRSQRTADSSSLAQALTLSIPPSSPPVELFLSVSDKSRVKHSNVAHLRSLCPVDVTGWEATAGSTESFTAADDWNGRVCAFKHDFKKFEFLPHYYSGPRTHCDFSTDSTLPSTCGTGGCNGGLECATSGGTGVPPATLAGMIPN